MFLTHRLQIFTSAQSLWYATAPFWPHDCSPFHVAKLQQETLVNHILSLYAGKVAAFSRDDKRLEIRLDREAEGR